MRFEINDVVTCTERPGHVGRVLRVRRGAGLARVAWSQHVVSWHDDETLRRVNESEDYSAVPAKPTQVFNGGGSFSRAMTVSANGLSAKTQTCKSLLGGQTGRSWFNFRPLTDGEREREARRQERRELEIENAHGKKYART